VLVLDLMGGSAFAWQEGVEYTQVIERCEGLTLNGATSMALRLLPTDGSFGKPRLVGIEGDRTLWEQPLPKPDEVNAAKLFANRDGDVIRIYSEFPGSAGGYGAVYKWQAGKAHLLSQGPTTRSEWLGN
jgi:hypothetical protein